MSAHNKITRRTIIDIRSMKKAQEKISMLTAYDYPMACILDECDIDIILVGDSLGNVVLGYESTLPVTMDDMVRHTQAVTRGVQKALVVADMPFMSYQVSAEAALANAGRLLKEGNAQAVKLEGGREHADIVYKMTYAGIPVMAHLGLTPQSVNQLGGYKVQGKNEDAAKNIIRDAKILEEAGAFSLVLECVPQTLAKEISASLTIPTIGIGAGNDCDGQVLVINDMLGITDRAVPKFVKQYALMKNEIKNAVKSYISEVKTGAFPDEGHSYK